MSHTYPKLHNAMWPGLVGKEPGTDHPPISLDRMLELTAKASVDGQKFEGVDLFLFHPHIDPEPSDDAIRPIADPIAGDAGSKSARGTMYVLETASNLVPPMSAWVNSQLYVSSSSRGAAK